MKKLYVYKNICLHFIFQKTNKQSNREEKKQKKADKKRKATERHKAKLNGCIQQEETDEDEMLIQTMHTLKI